MGHVLFSELASALFLLLLGATRCRYVLLASAQPTDGSRSAVNLTRQIPAYLASTAWVAYVAWLIVAPEAIIQWDRWPLDHQVSDLLAWIAFPLLAAGLWLFWYSHQTIGRYWSIQVALKKMHRLVTDGPYRYIRHPLYTALFLGYVGTALAMQSWVLIAWFPAFIASYLLFAREEERFMEAGFGEAYIAYRHLAGPFFPKLTSLRIRILPRYRATTGSQDRHGYLR